MKTVKFLGIDCAVGFARYGGENGPTAIVLTDAETGEPVAKATVNVPEYLLEPGQVLIKNWSENEGILAALCEAGILEDTGDTVPTGYVEANVCELLVDPSLA